MKKQTSVDWLQKELIKRFKRSEMHYTNSEWYFDMINKLSEQARAMHEEEVSDAWVNGNDCEPKEVTEYYARRYYKQTFKTK